MQQSVGFLHIYQVSEMFYLQDFLRVGISRVGWVIVARPEACAPHTAKLAVLTLAVSN